MRREVNLRLAELRKRQRKTQQEIADAVGTDCRNISKWENGTTMPDIRVIPFLSDYFGVTADELLGLVPLRGEEYVASGTDSSEFWDKKLEYLLRKSRRNWNVDYLEFLLKSVWGLTVPSEILDLGCGYGYMGALLLPLLPEGSRYTGLDFSEELIKYGRRLFEDENLPGELHQEDIVTFETGRFLDRFDLVLCQSVFRHMGDADAVVERMIACAKPGGLVACIDTNREFECDGLFVDGMDYAGLCDHRGAEKCWRAELKNGDRDYAAAMRNAYRMRRLGLKDIQIRMNDKVSFVCPEQEHYEQSVDDFLRHNCGWRGEEEPDAVIGRLMNRGMSRREAEHYSARESEIEQFFAAHRGEVSFTQFRGKMITFGRK